ncbi:MAG: hypothetical protein RMY34_11520 [Aulosira sp. DedQUE10]|nr:hypothetical protein [Aulosira sp. DedQUE10]
MFPFGCDRHLLYPFDMSRGKGDEEEKSEKDRNAAIALMLLN